MSPVHKLSQIGSLTGNKIDYPSMLAGYGDFGALQRIGYLALNGSTAGFSFSNIPQTFQDLILVVNGRSSFSSTSAQVYTYINSDGSALYSRTRLYGTGAVAASDRTANDSAVFFAEVPAATSGSGIFGSAVVHFMNYASTSTFKTVLCRSACDLNGSGFSHLWVNTYRSTNAIRNLDIFASNATNWVAGSTFALYGVRASAA